MQIGSFLLWFIVIPFAIAIVMFGIVRLEMILMVKLIKVNIPRKIRFYFGLITFVSIYLLTLALAISKVYL